MISLLQVPLPWICCVVRSRRLSIMGSDLSHKLRQVRGQELYSLGIDAPISDKA